jgi:hypothetical protein
MFSREEQEEKASEPIYLILSGIVILFKPLLSKALVSMSVSPSGRITSSRLLHP